MLEYTLWQRFSNAIKKAIENCKNSNYNTLDRFIIVDKMVNIGSNTIRNVSDYKLSRYACYIIVLNCDPIKKVIALAKTYFAIQTRKQELSEKEYSELTEVEKRFYKRNLTKKGNYSLNIAAKNAEIKNFDKFHNSGYKGLYNGETANNIAKRKNLRYREDILDNMGSTELATNLFRITQTEDKLINDKIEGEKMQIRYIIQLEVNGKNMNNELKEDIDEIIYHYIAKQMAKHYNIQYERYKNEK